MTRLLLGVGKPDAALGEQSPAVLLGVPAHGTAHLHVAPGEPLEVTNTRVVEHVGAVEHRDSHPVSALGSGEYHWMGYVDHADGTFVPIALLLLLVHIVHQRRRGGGGGSRPGGDTLRGIAPANGLLEQLYKHLNTTLYTRQQQALTVPLRSGYPMNQHLAVLAPTPTPTPGIAPAAADGMELGVVLLRVLQY